MKHKASIRGLRNADINGFNSYCLMIGLIATPSRIVAQTAAPGARNDDDDN